MHAPGEMVRTGRDTLGGAVGASLRGGSGGLSAREAPATAVRSSPRLMIEPLIINGGRSATEFRVPYNPARFRWPFSCHDSVEIRSPSSCLRMTLTCGLREGRETWVALQCFCKLGEGVTPTFTF